MAGGARGPRRQSWGCSPWNSATATSTARGSGRGFAPTKWSSRGPTSSSKSSSRTGRTSSRRPKVSGDLGAGGRRRGGAAGRSLSLSLSPAGGGGRAPARGQRPGDFGGSVGSRGPGVFSPRLPGSRSQVPFPAPTPFRRSQGQGALRERGSARPGARLPPDGSPSVPAFAARLAAPEQVLMHLQVCSQPPTGSLSPTKQKPTVLLVW